MTINILFNADDFGLTKGVTDGIVQAHLNGCISSTTLMMNGMATDYAVQLAKKVPSLDVGIHLVLTWGGKPVHPDVPGLVDKDGSFKFTNRYQTEEPPNPEEVKKEWRAQLDAFLATGLPLHHIDSHHHVHGWEPLKQVILEIANEYKVPVRYVDSLQDHPEILLTDSLWLDFYGDGIYHELFGELEKTEGKSIEIMTHPGIMDEDLVSVSSYTKEREKELEILCSLESPGWANVL